jgi:hypothetical protein
VHREENLEGFSILGNEGLIAPGAQQDAQAFAISPCFIHVVYRVTALRNARLVRPGPPIQGASSLLGLRLHCTRKTPETTRALLFDLGHCTGPAPGP